MEQSVDKKSVDVVSLLVEFLEVAVHQILYTRHLYPESIFVLKKKYNIPVWMSVHPAVNSYIKQTFTSVRYLAENQKLQSLAVVFCNSDNIAIEKHSFDVLSMQSDYNGLETSDPYLIQLQESLREYCLKLGANNCTRLPRDSSFRLVVCTSEQGSVALSHEPSFQDFPMVTAEDRQVALQNPSLVPLHTVSSDYFRLQTYFEA